MNDSLSYSTRQKLVAALRVRYQNTSKPEKSRILNEFVALTGSHRKHAIRVLQQNSLLDGQTASVPGRKIYDAAVCEALVVVWEAADRICGKRLKAILPQFVDAMERHGHLKLNSEVKQRLLSASPATLDRLLRSKREKSKLRPVKRSPTKASRQVPIKTFGEWQEPQPGETEMDFVVHCGGQAAGENGKLKAHFEQVIERDGEMCAMVAVQFDITGKVPFESGPPMPFTFSGEGHVYRSLADKIDRETSLSGTLTLQMVEIVPGQSHLRMVSEGPFTVLETISKTTY